jgi:hypothetical protein
MKFDIVRYEQLTLLKLCVRTGFGIDTSAITFSVWACMAEKR